jgi:hypothetical protein
MPYNPNPGMNEAQEKKDRAGFHTTVENVTGGETKDVGDGCGPEVGNPYDGDPMGEEYAGVTYKDKK